jgi:hypothetical protein
MEGLLAVNAKRISGLILGIIIALDDPTLWSVPPFCNLTVDFMIVRCLKAGKYV